MDLRLLEYFHHAAMLLSFTRAAERLHVTQSALSQGIKLLETRLGRSLFVRGRKLALTEFGHEFLVQSRGVIEAMEQLRSQLDPQAPGITGTVRAAVLVSALAYVIPPVIARFTREHPGVSFDFVKTDPAAIQAHVAKGEVHFGIMPLPVPPGPLESRPLREFPFVLAVPVAWRRERLKSLLAGRPLVVLAPWQIEELRRKTDLIARFPAARFQEGTNCVMITRQLVSMGVGPGVIPSYALGPDLHVLETFPEHTLTLHLVLKKNRLRFPASERFLELLEEPPLSSPPRSGYSGSRFPRSPGKKKVVT